MATVKFSGELRDRIVNTAKQKFQPEVNKASESSPKDWGNRLYDIIFGKYTTALGELPDFWFSKVNSLTIYSIGHTRVNLEYPLKPARLWPAAMPDKTNKHLLAHKYSAYSDGLVLNDCEAFAEFKAEVDAWQKRVSAAVGRQQEFADSVKKVINAYVTLAPALKAWPPLWDLIPEDVKEKHRKIVTREKSDSDELDVDLDRMTALASFSKIKGNV